MTALRPIVGGLLAFAFELAACGAAADGTGPSAQDPSWAGTWTLISVNGTSVPADATIAGYSERVVSRTLSLQLVGTGIWKDSTLSALLCVPASANKTTECNGSGFAQVTWTVSGSTLTMLANPAQVTGYVVPVKKFVKQADGTLLKTDDDQTEVYRRQ